MKFILISIFAHTKIDG